MFFTDVNNLCDCFKDICKPFEEELIGLDRGEVMAPEIQSCLRNLVEMNEKNIKTFVNRD